MNPIYRQYPSKYRHPFWLQWISPLLMASTLLLMLFLSPLVTLGVETSPPLTNTNTGMLVRIDRPVKLILDGQPYSLRFLAFMDPEGNTMLSLSDSHELFKLNIEPGENQDLILSSNQQVLTLGADSYLKFDSWPMITVEKNEAIRLDMFYLPLDRVVAVLQYHLTFDPTQNAVLINSPGFQSGTPSLPSSSGQTPAIADVFASPLPHWGDFKAVPVLKSLWPDQEIVGGFYTTLQSSPSGRTSNIILSCGKIHEKTVKPGEVFSFNRVIGERTVREGYQTAPIFVGKKVGSGVGGGICQTASTLYNTAVEAGMQVLERHHHSLPVKYVPSGQDATVSWGTADLKFRNVKDFPVKILAQVYNKYVILAIARAQ